MPVNDSPGLPKPDLLTKHTDGYFEPPSSISRPLHHFKDKRGLQVDLSSSTKSNSLLVASWSNVLRRFLRLNPDSKRMKLDMRP